MTQLDHAFIKAYTRHDPSAEDTARDAGFPVRRENEFCADSPPEITGALRDDSLEEMVHNLETTAPKSFQTPPPTAVPANIDQPGATQSQRAKFSTAEELSILARALLDAESQTPSSKQEPVAEPKVAVVEAAVVEEPELSKVIHRLDCPAPQMSQSRAEAQAVPPPHIETLSEQSREESTAEKAPELAVYDASEEETSEEVPQQTDDANDNDANDNDANDNDASDDESNHDDAVDLEPSEQPLHPMLQVDDFQWPRAYKKLCRRAQGELDRLAEGLLDVTAGGQKILALGSCQNEEGTTTLVLCAGRLLAERGWRVIMVDANFARPKLAQHLGLAPASGWEEVLAERLPLEEVIIESVARPLAVLPLLESWAEATVPPEYEDRMAADLRTLAVHYDLVLLDVGSVVDPQGGGRLPIRAIAEPIEAMIMVHRVDRTPEDRLARVQRRMAAGGITQAGTIRNFVRA